MPPHLHPRSTATSTLFAGTLLASFVVVGIPHVFPCPRPRTGYADTEMQYDEEGRPIRRRKVVKRRPLDDSVGEEADQQHLRIHQSTPDISQQPQLLSQSRSIPPRRSKNLIQPKDISEEAALFQELQREAEALEREARECPVPKPRGILGRLLGFEVKDEGAEEKRPPPAPSLTAGTAGGSARD